MNHKIISDNPMSLDGIVPTLNLDRPIFTRQLDSQGPLVAQCKILIQELEDFRYSVAHVVRTADNLLTGALDENMSHENMCKLINGAHILLRKFIQEEGI